MNRLRLAALLLAGASGAFAKDNPLVGAWTIDGAPYAELRSDGTGTVRGEKVKWQAKAGFLALSYASGNRELMAYAISGNKLTVTMNGESQILARGSGKSGRGGKPGKGSAPAQAAGGREQLSALLLSSPWCSFTYNQVSGASRSERVVFRHGGTWSSGARGESYSSGAYGSVAGQSESEGGGRWQVRGGSLFMSEGAEPLEDAGLTVSRNSSGYPILKSGGKEYSQCR